MSFEERLRSEYEELGARIADLRVFIKSPAFSGARPVQQEQLPLQLSAMMAYQKCLRIRIEDLERANLGGSEVDEGAPFDPDSPYSGPVSPDLIGADPIVFPDETDISACGLPVGLAGRLHNAGFLMVGQLREAYVSALQDGDDLLSLPGIGARSVPVVIEKLLNDKDYANLPTSDVVPDSDEEGD